MVQIDIIDGIFAEEKTIKIGEIKELKELEGLRLDFHLMVSEPVLLVDICRGVGGYRVIGQVEMMNDQEEFVRMVRDRKMLAGLAIDLETPVKAIEKKLFKELDCVLVMTIVAGASGRSFQRKALKKIKKLKSLSEKHGGFNIAVDGGLNKETVVDCVKAGANHLGVTSAIFRAKDVGKAIEELRGLAKR